MAAEPPIAMRAGRAAGTRWPVRMLWRLRRWALVMIALQAPTWLLQMATDNLSFEERPLFNLDLVLAAIFACFSTILGVVALSLAWLAEGLRAAAKNYHFMSVFDFVDAGRFAHLLSLGQFITLPGVVAVMALGLCTWIVLRQTRGCRSMALPLAAALLVLPVLDGLNGSLRLLGLGGDSTLARVNVAGSPTWNILNSLRAGLYSESAPRPTDNPVAFRRMRDWHAAHPGQGILLVLVESMGQPRSPALAGWLAARLDVPALRGRWRLHAGTEPFAGNTTAAELRVLCGLRGHYSRLTDTLAADCLPEQWRREGAPTAAFHGFHLRMFDRREWWPRIGLTPWDGHAPDDRPLPTGCNRAFPGVCDRALLQQAVGRLDAEPGGLVYVLTLDTHLPLADDGQVLDADLAARCVGLNTPVTACRFVARVGGVLDMLAAELVSSDKTPLVVVVGDHSPPFAERTNRDTFDAESVPLFVLEPVP